MDNKNEITKYEPSKELALMGEQVRSIIGYNPIQEIFDVGNRVQAIQALFSEPSVSKMLAGLENNPNGFLTDLKNNDKYPPEARARAIIGCVSQGARVVNNEINIIKGRGMLVKNFYKRMITELGHDNSPSSDCAYKMVNWWPDDEFLGVKDKVASFKIIVSGKWEVKSTKKTESFSWEKKVDVKFGGGDYDTIDKARGQAERRAWMRFYEEHGGKVIEDDGPEPISNEGSEKPKTSVGKLSDVMELKTEKEKEPVEEAQIVNKEEKAPEVSKEPASKPAATASVHEDKPPANPGPNTTKNSGRRMPPNSKELF